MKTRYGKKSHKRKQKIHKTYKKKRKVHGKTHKKLRKRNTRRQKGGLDPTGIVSGVLGPLVTGFTQQLYEFPILKGLSLTTNDIINQLVTLQEELKDEIKDDSTSICREKKDRANELISITDQFLFGGERGESESDSNYISFCRLNNMIADGIWRGSEIDVCKKTKAKDLAALKEIIKEGKLEEEDDMRVEAADDLGDDDQAEAADFGKEEEWENIPSSPPPVKVQINPKVDATEAQISEDREKLLAAKLTPPAEKKPRNPRVNYKEQDRRQKIQAAGMSWIERRRLKKKSISVDRPHEAGETGEFDVKTSKARGFRKGLERKVFSSWYINRLNSYMIEANILIQLLTSFLLECRLKK